MKGEKKRSRIRYILKKHKRGITGFIFIVIMGISGSLAVYYSQQNKPLENPLFLIFLFIFLLCLGLMFYKIDKLIPKNSIKGF